MTVLPTGQKARLVRLDGVRAVLFDVYGTMFISASGDIGLSREQRRILAMDDALRAVGIEGVSAEQAVQLLHDTIAEFHRAAIETGVEYPEVNILEILPSMLERLQADTSSTRTEAARMRLATEFECRVNPVWPMPSLETCLQRLRAHKLVLGIVSNAQFFTQEVPAALLGQTFEELGFDPAIQFFSYCYKQSKPGKFLFDRALEQLNQLGIDARQVLYIGNDMLNDMLPAQAAGFHTALFAGDNRSLRLREDDPRVADVHPDMVITDLSQVPSCLSSES